MDGKEEGVVRRRTNDLTVQRCSTYMCRNEPSSEVST